MIEFGVSEINLNRLSFLSASLFAPLLWSGFDNRLIDLILQRSESHLSLWILKLLAFQIFLYSGDLLKLLLRCKAFDIFKVPILKFLILTFIVKLNIRRFCSHILSQHNIRKIRRCIILTFVQYADVDANRLIFLVKVFRLKF